MHTASTTSLTVVPMAFFSRLTSSRLDGREGHAAPARVTATLNEVRGAVRGSGAAVAGPGPRADPAHVEHPDRSA